MRSIRGVLEELRRVLRSPRVVSVSLHPAGWLAITRGQLEPVLAWAVFEDGHAVGLVGGRRGLRPAAGRRFSGYLSPSATGAGDVQAAPAVPTVVADLEEAIGSGEVWTQQAQLGILERLQAAAVVEWARPALAAFVLDPERFLRRHFELVAEHGRPAQLDADWRTGLASLSRRHTAAGAAEEDR